MNICNLDIGHFNLLNLIEKTTLRSLKNLPTTWGLRRIVLICNKSPSFSEKPPHHMGIKTAWFLACFQIGFYSEKPPHHMGIKTLCSGVISGCPARSEKPPHHMGIKTLCSRTAMVYWTLKNLPTTWGLRLIRLMIIKWILISEKPPHHMGIKTILFNRFDKH